jgi:hypothetical protein
MASWSAQAVSGKTYRCESNPAGIETFRMDLAGEEQATLFLRMDGTDLVLPIGLDGSYHLSPQGAGYRGYWEDGQTFQFEAFDIGPFHRQPGFAC